MADNYKLTYLTLRAKGENARQLFALAGVEYKDNRVEREDFPPMKPSTPFGQIPVLEVDGKQLAQSYAISRYLANKFGFAGKCDWETAQIDALVDQFRDYSNELRPYFLVATQRNSGQFGPKDKDQLYHDIAEPGRDKFFPIIAKYLRKNKSGFLIGDKVSWVDLLLAEHVATYETLAEGFADGYPEIVAHKNKVRSIPELKKWIETRPETFY